MKFKTIKKDMINWMKKITYNTDSVSEKNNEHNEHCNNFATHCCLSCDKCWGKKYRTQNNKKLQ